MAKVQKIFVLILFFLPFISFSQGDTRPVREKKEKEPFEIREKLYWGSGISLYADRSNFMLDISPQLGYKIYEKFSVGVQALYTYQSLVYRNKKYDLSIYGGGIFARYVILDWLFVQAEYDILSVPNYNSNNLYPRRISDEKMLGVGFKNGDKDFSYFVNILYNYNPGINSPYYGYAIPIVYRAGFNVNF